MNHEIQILVDKANKIMNKTGNKPGTRYPETLKRIVISMRLDHNLSVREIMKHVGVSSYSARVWAMDFKKQNVFRELVVKEHQNKKSTTEVKMKKHVNELKSIEFSLKILIMLITLLIFESLAFHLFV